jgi:hypothetical protein
MSAETIETRKRLSTLSLAQLRQNVEAVLKTHDMFIYADKHNITNLLSGRGGGGVEDRPDQPGVTTAGAWN